MAVQIVPRWEWRTFAHRAPRADALFDAMTPTSVEVSDELYLLARGGDNVKVRDELIDVKVLRETGETGLQRLEPVLKMPFPLQADAAQQVFRSLRKQCPPVGPGGLTLEELVRAAQDDDVLVLPVHKTRTRYFTFGCSAERTIMEVAGHGTRSIAVESPDASAVSSALDSLGLQNYVNLDVPTGLRLLVEGAPERYAVIDIGTNSVKLHVAELDQEIDQEIDEDGQWRTVADRALVTRLGDGLAESGVIGPEPLDRTVRAVEELAEEARLAGARAIAAVATAGARRARNQAELVSSVRDRCGLVLEVLPGEDEAHLAYLAVAAGVGLGDGRVVAFDTGGGSSQFTFGRGSVVEERFSLEVGAVQVTERFGLANAVSPDVLNEARAALAAALVRLEGRPRPAGVVAMGGAMTNLAAVRHGLATYDPDVVQGTVLDRDEIDRQIELYRSMDAAQRREIVGLQPARAEVILAGACIVRTILDLLDVEAVKVSDHGLRHGVLLAHFGASLDVPSG